MKRAWMLLGALLSVAGIVLLVLWMTSGMDNSRLLGTGLLCTSTGSLLNLYFQHRARKGTQKHE